MYLLGKIKERCFLYRIEFIFLVIHDIVNQIKNVLSLDFHHIINLFEGYSTWFIFLEPQQWYGFAPAVLLITYDLKYLHNLI